MSSLLYSQELEEIFTFTSIMPNLIEFSDLDNTEAHERSVAKLRQDLKDVLEHKSYVINQKFPSITMRFIFNKEGVIEVSELVFPKDAVLGKLVLETMDSIKMEHDWLPANSNNEDVKILKHLKVFLEYDESIELIDCGQISCQNKVDQQYYIFKDDVQRFFEQFKNFRTLYCNYPKIEAVTCVLDGNSYYLLDEDKLRHKIMFNRINRFEFFEIHFLRVDGQVIIGEVTVLKSD